MIRRRSIAWSVTAAAALALACGGEETPAGRGAGAAGSGARGGGPPGGAPQTAVPVEVATVERGSISSFIETNGTLEAENEVDIVARASGPIVLLEAEETMTVSKGQLLARIDPREIEARLEISRVALEDARQAYERAQRLKNEELVSQEAFEDAKANFESAQAAVERDRVELSYTDITAPFAGLIVNRYIKFAQNVSPGDPLFRISDFDPLLCPIQVPERNIPQLATGQRAFLEVEAWPGERFVARVLRLSPVVDAATGTVRVTLEVEGRGRLRPGMFASVFLETATHEDTLVIPKTALALESIGDAVYVANDGAAARREVELGFSERDRVEVLSGLEAGELIVTVGQDGLSDGTPIQILGQGGPEAARAAASGGRTPGVEAAGRPDEASRPTTGPATGGGESGVRRPGGEDPGSERRENGESDGASSGDLSSMTPAQLERLREHLRSTGLTDQQIDERLGRQNGGQVQMTNGRQKGDRYK